MAKVSRTRSHDLVELLVHTGRISEDESKTVRDEMGASDEFPEQIMLRRGLVTEEGLVQTLVTQFSLPYIRTEQYFSDKEALSSLPVEFMLKHRVVPLDKFGDLLVLAVAGVIGSNVLEEISRRTNCQVRLYATTVSDLERKLGRISEEILGPPEAETQQEGEDAEGVAEVEGEIAVAGQEDGQGDVESEIDEISHEAEKVFEDLRRDLERFGTGDSEVVEEDGESFPR